MCRSNVFALLCPQTELGALTFRKMYTCECKAFFKMLEGLSAFFSKSTKRTYLLDNVVKRRLPRTSPARWSSNSRLLQTVSVYHSDLLMVFRVIGDAEDKWDNDSVKKAAGFKRWLFKTNTCFLIIACEEIFNKTDALFRVLQNKLMDIAFLLRANTRHDRLC